MVEIFLSDVQRAAARLQGQVLNTPCLESQTLGQIAGTRLFLKFENLQFTASFKERGALNKLTALREAAQASGLAPPAGVVAASAGNHAQGVAHHAKRMGWPATIFMPRLTPMVKVERTRHLGAQVVLHGDSFDEAKAQAQSFASEHGLTFIHAFDDADVIAGQGTIALEMLLAQPQIDTLVVAVGGGGLIGGMAVAARALRPGIRIIGVQTLRFPGMVNAIKGTQHPQGTATLAEGIAVGQPGQLTQALIRQHVDDLVLVDEGDIEQALVLLLDIEKTLVEGAGAAGLAAVLKEPQRYAGRNVGLVLCGGNIDPLLLAEIIEHGMVKAGRLARISVSARDVPGALAKITAVVAQAGANIDEVHHQRMFSGLSAQNVQVDLVVQTRNREQVQQLLASLSASGFEAKLTG